MRGSIGYACAGLRGQSSQHDRDVTLDAKRSTEQAAQQLGDVDNTGSAQQACTENDTDKQLWKACDPSTVGPA